MENKQHEQNKDSLEMIIFSLGLIFLIITTFVIMNILDYQFKTFFYVFGWEICFVFISYLFYHFYQKL